MIRPATSTDLPAILQLIRALAEYEKLTDQVVVNEAQLREHLFGPRPYAEVLLAEDGGRVVGYALFFHTYSTFLGCPSLYLEDLFVLPEHRGRGHGKALLARLARLAVERDCGRFEWMVLDWNTPAIVDVDYRPDATVAACVVFRDWGDAAEAAHFVDRGPPAEPYVPGEFYRRELPGLLRVLALVPDPLSAVVIDGYVWLAGTARPGLGAHLYEALGRRVPVIGVAKTAFLASHAAVPVLRGSSQRPLLVTAVGVDVQEAAACIQRMHGPSRLPTLLKRADRLCREA